MNTKDREGEITLEILEVVEEGEGVTQRHMAKRLGVALGMANSYLKRCANKGLIKIHQAPANRYLYYLTPQGFTEKSRLTASYLSSSLGFYRKAGASCAKIFEICQKMGKRRLLLCGISDLAEIATLRAVDFDIQVVGVYDSSGERDRFLDQTVWRNLPETDSFDICLITDLDEPFVAWQRLKERVPAERIMVPDILGMESKNGAQTPSL